MSVRRETIKAALLKNLLRSYEEMEQNDDGIRAVVAWIEHDPEAWDQNVYSGTTLTQPLRGVHCVAAWTCVLAGINIGVMVSTYDILNFAQHLLGLTRQHANQLFWWGVGLDEHPTVEQLKARVTEVTGVTFDPMTTQTQGDRELVSC